MAYADKHNIETYSGLIESLSSSSKLELLEKLTKSIKKDRKNIEIDFYKSFGAFASEKSAEEIIAEIKISRNFKERNLIF